MKDKTMEDKPKIFYKIWTYIERHNEEEGSYMDLGDPIEIGEFRTFDEAEEFRQSLYEAYDRLEREEMLDVDQDDLTKEELEALRVDRDIEEE